MVSTETGHPAPGSRAATLAVVVAALGYFVDVYDLILFGMVRTASLQDLAIPADELKDTGIYLLNMQMAGMLVGGVLWGVLGDKRGRLKVLFGSIALYSLANIANGMVDTVDQYAWCRVIAGIGLAGELGAGITLVSELMHKQTRGVATTIVATFGLAGGVTAGLVGGALPGIGLHWRTAYYVGGGMGLVLLIMRVGVMESGMYARAAVASGISRGNFFSLFDRTRIVRYLAIILVGVPVWYVMGILGTFSPEIGKGLGLAEAPRAPVALFLAYSGATLGDLASGLISQRLQSRRRTLTMFLSGLTLACALYFLIGSRSSTMFYATAGACGFFAGYWAVFVTTAAELFGTNLRATVATTVPNFTRGAVIPLTTGLTALDESIGIVGAAIVVGVVTLSLAFVGVWSLRETFGEDLDYHE